MHFPPQGGVIDLPGALQVVREMMRDTFLQVREMMRDTIIPVIIPVIILTTTASVMKSTKDDRLFCAVGIVGVFLAVGAARTLRR